MCGIFGILASDKAEVDRESLQEALKRLFLLSESRGKEAAGLALAFDKRLNVLKSEGTPSELVRSSGFRKLFQNTLPNGGSPVGPIAVVGHSRMVTNGSQLVSDNNQPVITPGSVGVHNGIIVNVDELWQRFPSLSRKFEIDTEVLLQLLSHYLKEEKSLEIAAQRAFQEIKGAASVAVFLEEMNSLLLATNNGSLYVVEDETSIVFASEEYILRKFVSKGVVGKIFSQAPIIHVAPGQGVIIDLESLKSTRFSLKNPEALEVHKSVESCSGPHEPYWIVEDVTPRYQRFSKHKTTALPSQRSTSTASSSTGLSSTGLSSTVALLSKTFDTEFAKREEQISKLRRCTRCILPETMPFIEFDQSGVCNYCHNYQKITVHGKAAFEAELSKFRTGSHKADCILSFSGGRDSSYGLHYVTQVMGMKPVAYTYDWGLVTDLARRNISRMCGQLGIEHILVSADIRKKRENVRKNIGAWLKSPKLGLVPLFMAGDKQFFYYANKLKEQYGVQAVIFSENRLETTYFKTGFCGVKPLVLGGHTYQLPTLSKIQLAWYYAQSFLENPKYLNSSLVDTFAAYCSYYVIPHDFIWTYNYIPWNEDEINDVLINEYEWETASDTKSTWRIGDGTASFYNYIYYMVAGLTENDTFRSNQIREGMITREKALSTIQEENRPRWDTLQWYGDIIGFDCIDAVKRINAMTPIYALGR
ncbi:MAG: hypothetical protein KDD60_01210 [Bdellovibrionales bacterium]|nr:hypothetical protein [Bdellovibrionales bacterium]